MPNIPISPSLVFSDRSYIYAEFWLNSLKVSRDVQTTTSGTIYTKTPDGIVKKTGNSKNLVNIQNPKLEIKCKVN